MIGKSQWQLALAGLLFLSTILPAVAADDFVTRSGTKLMLHGKPFRFSGANLDYLALASDSFGRFGSTDMYYPSKYMIDDAFATMNKMGGRVSRVWSTGSQGCALCVEPELGKFNEAALKQIDYVVYSAGKHHVRLILLFVDPYGFYTGGIQQYQKWRGGGDFFRDPQLIADYKQYVSVLINRKNTYTGIAYKDDPAILGWQAGNELPAPIEWNRDIARYIKSLDPNHLILAWGLSHDVETELWSIPEIDVADKHYYPKMDFLWMLDRDKEAAKQAGKVFLVGEYGWNSTNLSISELKANLSAIEADPNTAGDMFWALRGRKDGGEFMPVPGPPPGAPADGSYWAPGGSADGNWWALYYPGRKTTLNEADDMRLRVGILASHAKAMAGAGAK